MLAVIDFRAFDPEANRSSKLNYESVHGVPLTVHPMQMTPGLFSTINIRRFFKPDVGGRYLDNKFVMRLVSQRND